ncbi:MAG: hypothetical protein ACREK4_13750 [Candidatus Rokuibacteriota bacterium]
MGIVLSRRFANPRAKVAVRMAAIGAAVVLAEGGALAAVQIRVGERFGVSREGRPSRDAVASSQYRDEYKDLVSHPRFREVTAGKSPAEVRALAAILTTRGLQYLDLPALQEWARIKLRMAERSPKLCAGMWKGRVDDPALGARTLTELGEPDARAWARLSARASLLALQDAPAPSADGDARVLAVRSIIATLPEGARPAAIADVVKRDELSDERACELMRLMLEGSRALAPGLRHAFLRALTQQ